MQRKLRGPITKLDCMQSGSDLAICVRSNNSQLEYQSATSPAANTAQAMLHLR